jgi:DNA polymerase-3 subunit gamma/tau
MAKALNCAKGPTPQPCNACPACAEITDCRSLDVLEIDGASNRGIDAIRELRETVRYAPARDRYKVYIVDEVHMLTPEAWNALLKTLEEPPAHVVFLFATTDYRKIPLTILSRCQHFEFRKIPHAELIRHLKTVAEGEKVTVPASALDLIARLAEGSLRDAQSALDQVIAFSGDSVTDEQARLILGVIDRDLVRDFFAAVRGRDSARLMAIVETVFDRGYPPVQFLEDLMALGRDFLLARAVPDPRPYLAGSAEEVEDLIGRAAAFSEDDLLRILELLTREEQRLKNSSHPRFLMEALAIKLARLADLTPIEDLIARADRPAAPGGPPARSPQPPPGKPVSGTAAPRAPSAAVVQSPAILSDAPGERDQALVEAFLRRVQEERGALGGFLGQAAWIDVAEETLQIAFDARHVFFKEKVESRENLQYLGEAARAVAGRALHIKVVVATNSVAGAAARGAAAGGTAASGESDDARRKRLHEEALNEPVVRSLLERFGGQIVDVEAT